MRLPRKIRFTFAVLKDIFTHPLRDTLICEVDDGLTPNEWEIRRVVLELLKDPDLELLSPETWTGIVELKQLVTPDSDKDCIDCGH